MWIWSSWSRTVRGAAVGVACALFCWYCDGSVLIRSAENWALDNCFVFRGERPSKAPVVVVGIDDRTLRALGKPLAFGSPELAEVVTFLHKQGAKAVGIDFLIPEDVDARDYFKPGSQGDAESLGIAVAQAKNVVLPEWELEGKWLRPLYQWTVKHQIEPAWTDLAS